MAGIDAYAKLVLHGDGTDGSTTITDSSLAPHTMTANGGAHIETDQKKFGTASIQLNNATADYVTAPDSADWDFGSGAWTIEMWIYPTTLGADSVLIDNRGTSTNVGWVFFVNSSDQLDSFVDDALRVDSGATTISINTWYHVAYVRNGDTLKVYIDGTEAGTYDFSASYSISDAAGGTPLLRLGIRNDNTFGFRGYIDEVRVSKGIARYTANFTPPTTAFSLDRQARIINFL